MATTIQEGGVQGDARVAVTPETISDIASQADIGPIDHREALMIKLCETREENKYKDKLNLLKSQIIELDVKYKNILRELRDTLQSIKFDDFLKILLGISGGIIVRSGHQQSFPELLKDGMVLFSGLIFIISLFILTLRYVGPSTRKSEIIEEIKRVNEKND